MERISRRAFLSMAAAAAPAMDVLDLFAKTRAGEFKEVEFYSKMSGAVQCQVCPLNCVLKPGETCFCRTRKNHDGKLLSHAYANPCILTIDPIEKLPLSHFLPGEQALSLAVGGCNLRCVYCQNWNESQSRPEELNTFDVSKEKAVDGAVKKSTKILAYTYTEPVAFYEYARDVSALAKERGCRNVAATALFINERPLRELAKTVDAFAVALKGFDEKYYEKSLGVPLAPTLRAIETLAETKAWFELVTLIVPTLNDDLGKIREMVAWIRKSLGTKVPLHFGRFIPQYRLKDLPRTPVSTLEKCRDVAREAGLEHVYIFNVSPHEGNNTICPGCKKTVIERLGFKVLKNDLVKGTCRSCGTRLPGIWE